MQTPDSTPVGSPPAGNTTPVGKRGNAFVETGELEKFEEVKEPEELAHETGGDEAGPETWWKPSRCNVFDPSVASKKDIAMDVHSYMEARERMSFLATPLFADTLDAPKVHNMLSFKVIVPHSIEDINLSWRSFVQIRFYGGQC
ncbi:hypothetical protein K1719_028686 [Acacia pycnantha]|nr:hypothetical protein K1719_028686 [Acacia pycnantha]